MRTGSNLYDLYDLAHVAGWEPHNLHALLNGHVYWVGSVLYRSCTTCHDGRIGSVDGVDRDLSGV